MSKISVIIPSYNCESTIVRTINSVLSQSFYDFEIIAVNDGSKDKTEEVLNKLSLEDKRIKVFTKENGGVSSARNFGIDKSTGEYITFLDADDMFKDSFLEKMHKKAIENSSEVVCCGYFVQTKNSERKQKSFFKEKNILQEYILGNNQFHTSTWLIKNELISENNIKFDEDLSWGEDFMFFCEVLSSTKNVSLVKDYLSVYVDDDADDRLSSFDLKKIEKDKEMILRLINKPLIIKQKKIVEVLLNFRLPALQIYRLIGAYNLGYDLKEIRDAYISNLEYISNISNSYGLRSLKLYIANKKLSKIINNKY